MVQDLGGLYSDTRLLLQGYQRPYEDADVLVLTAPSTKFVDIRLPLIENIEEKTSLSNHPAFWAFTGTATTTFLENTAGVSMPYSAHCVWKHDVDSHGPGGGDEADEFLLPNGDCMEVGSMENPQTGRNEIYKEYWTGAPASADAKSPAKLPCVVAETVLTQECSRRGRIIRVGDYIQAVVEGEHDESDRVIVGRWIRTYENGHNEWNRDSRCQESEFPVSWVCEDSLVVGDGIEHNGVRWSLVEVVR